MFHLHASFCLGLFGKTFINFCHRSSMAILISPQHTTFYDYFLLFMFYECCKLVLNITFLLDFSLPIQCTFLRMICLFCNIIPRIEVIRLNKSFFFIQICDTFVDIEVTLRTDVYVKVDICEIENSRASSAKMSKGEV